MNPKFIGAILIVSGFGCVGLIIVSNQKKTVYLMQQLIACFEYMECELSYRMTSLPELFRKLPSDSSILQRYFAILANELEGQISPDVSCCVSAALSQVNDIPVLVKNGIIEFGKNAGYFDIDGQLKGIVSTKERCINNLVSYTNNQDVRLRNYQALALCAGAAVVILLL